MNEFDLASIEVTNSGLDAFLAESQGQTVAVRQAASSRVRVASLQQLQGFVRTAEDMLVHKSNRDLWALRQDQSGEFYIERMFDAQGAPLKG